MDQTGLKTETTGSDLSELERPLTPSEQMMREREAQWELYKIGKKYGIPIWLRLKEDKEDSNGTRS